MTQTLAPLDLVPSLPAGHTGVLSLTASAAPQVTPKRRPLPAAPAPAATADWLTDPKLAASLVDLARRGGLLPAGREKGEARSWAALRADAAPGKVAQHLETLQGLSGRRQRERLETLAVRAGLLPKPRRAQPRSPLGNDLTSKRFVGGRKPAGKTPASPLVHDVLREAFAAEVDAFGRQVARLQVARPGAAARALLDPDFEANLRAFAAVHNKLVMLPEAGRRLLLVSTLDPAGRPDAQARLDWQDLDELVDRLALRPWTAAGAPVAPAAPADAPVVRFNAYDLENCGHARALYSLQESEGARGLFEAVSLNFLDGRRKGRAPNPADAVARDAEAARLQQLFATYKVLPRLMAKGVAAAGARRSFFGHHPIELFVDTPAARAKFAAEDAAAAKQLMLRLNLDAAGLKQAAPLRPMLGFAERV